MVSGPLKVSVIEVGHLYNLKVDSYGNEESFLCVLSNFSQVNLLYFICKTSEIISYF